MHVESPRYQNKLHDIFFEGAAEAGIPQNLNFNDWGHGPVRKKRLSACQPGVNLRVNIACLVNCPCICII